MMRNVMEIMEHTTNIVISGSHVGRICSGIWPCRAFCSFNLVATPLRMHPQSDVDPPGDTLGDEFSNHFAPDFWNGVSTLRKHPA